MSVLRNKYGAKWNRRVHRSILPSRTTMNIWVKAQVNTRLQFKPIEYVSHRKLDYDVIL